MEKCYWHSFCTTSSLFGRCSFNDEVSDRITIIEPMKDSEVDLFSSEPIPARPSVSISQQRRSRSQRSFHPPTRTHTRPPPRPRTLPTTSSSTLSLVSNHKKTGTSQFKLGQYGPAIALLPPGHLLLVPLYTNRSVARLRCGEYVGAGEDAGEALKIICAVDSNTNANCVLWNPDTELLELIQGGREKVNEGGWLDSRGVKIAMYILGSTDLYGARSRSG